MVPLTQYRRAAHLVDANDAAAQLNELLYPNAQGQRGLAHAFLIGAILTIQVKRSMRYKDMFALPDDDQVA